MFFIGEPTMNITLARLVSARRFLAASIGGGLLLSGGGAPAAFAANWPNWRGPNGDGTTTTARHLAETWGPGKNIKWQREMPAWSGSSPMVWGDRIFLNSPSKEEARPAPEPAPGARKRPNPGAGRGLGMSGPGGQEILLLCLSRATGQEIWRRQYDQGNAIDEAKSLTPTTAGD